MRRSIALVCIVLGAMVSPAAGQDWLEARTDTYSVFYVAGSEADVELAKTWMNRAEEASFDRYGVRFSRYKIALYLHPAPVPTQNVNVGTARLICCNTNSGISTGTIHFLTPSYPGWRQGIEPSTGLAMDAYYQKRLMMHEYMTVAHYLVQESRGPSSAGAFGPGWQYYSAPDWFYQGLQEWDGLAASDKNYRETVSPLIIRKSRQTDGIVCCLTLDPAVPAVAVASVYVDGFTLLSYLSSRYGQDVAGRILRSDAATFWEAVRQSTSVDSPSALWEGLALWLKAQ